jgi:hypothetical protein
MKLILQKIVVRAMAELKVRGKAISVVESALAKD